MRPMAHKKEERLREYAKIALYKGEVVPMHYHSPYDYWQFPWEKHRLEYHSNNYHDQITGDPIWIWPDQTVLRRDSSLKYHPTEEEVEWLNNSRYRKTPPYMSPEAAYNMLKIIGFTDKLAWINNDLARVSRGRTYYRYDFAQAVGPDGPAASIVLLAVKHVRDNNIKS